MLGTTLATAPLTSSNLVGTRVFTLGLYTSMLMENEYSITQNNLLTGNNLKLEPSTVQDGEITQAHLLLGVDQNLKFQISSSAIRQVQFMVPLGQYLVTFVAPNTISQNHVINLNDLSAKGFVVHGLINQTHFMISNGCVLSTITDHAQLQQNHLIIPIGQYTNVDLTDLVNFGQNHIMVSFGSYSTTNISDPVDIIQLHNMISNGLILDPVRIGEPFVNPSTKRVVNITEDSQNQATITTGDPNHIVILTGDPNHTMLVTGDPNIIVLLNPDGNKYS